ncbi:hypothetical protein [Gordonia sp. OPL2]|uniref:hypothetical protein n=1 Tax=Gordonia sp. OPL2 TaxID=2486274 RepID=UPI0016567B95|nr:hypothetical protein [Gordonia sp. OPL2]ROZ89007.1 hypothetical protein EEB19_20070 [Gordonia sp. OPL2]
MRESLYNRCLTRAALPIAVRTNGTANGTTVDLGVYGNDFRAVLFIVTAATITDGSHAITMQESDDGTTWRAVPATKRLGALPTIVAANDDAIFEFGYVVGTAQFVRLVATTSGATGGGEYGAVAVLAEASSTPVARA